jgi:hypothetical protein
LISSTQFFAGSSSFNVPEYFPVTMMVFDATCEATSDGLIAISACPPTKPPGAATSAAPSNTAADLPPGDADRLKE